MKNNKAAMEMSVGTIVTIVLLMSVLVLGLMLTKNIFKSANGAIDLTDSELNEEIGKLFDSDDTQGVAIYPKAKEITLKMGEDGSFGVGIKNIADSIDASTEFGYVVVADGNTCGLSDTVSESLIVLGSVDEFSIPIGKTQVGEVTFKIKEGIPECIFRYNINVHRAGVDGDYESLILKVKVKA